MFQTAIDIFNVHLNPPAVFIILLVIGIDLYLVHRHYRPGPEKLARRRIHKARAMLAMAKSYNQQLEVMFKAAMVAHTALPSNKPRAGRKLAAEIKATEAIHIAFARATIASRRYLDAGLSQILQEYREAAGSAIDIAGDPGLIARRIMPIRTALTAATDKLEARVAKLLSEQPAPHSSMKQIA